MTPSLQKTATHLAAGAAILAIVLLSFVSVAYAYPDCTVNENTFEYHIYPRHCDPDIFKGKSKFIEQYCNDIADAETFCRMVQKAPGVKITVQDDNRIRYDAFLGKEVGTKKQKCGRVIIKSKTNGSVVTQFPQVC